MPYRALSNVINSSVNNPEALFLDFCVIKNIYMYIWIKPFTITKNFFNGVKKKGEENDGNFGKEGNLDKISHRLFLNFFLISNS